VDAPRAALRFLAIAPGALWTYGKLAWWGLVAPRALEREPLVVVQGVVRDDSRVLLAVRGDLRGWELPGGALEPGEGAEEALLREVREETGLRVELVRHVGDYVRTGFRPHTARVYLCRPVGGRLRASEESRALAWHELDALPDTLFPWFREPLADALREAPAPVSREEYQGRSAVLEGMRIDLRLRLRGDRAD
jgi:8-oxo-dGTP diphosphatase